MPSKRSRNKNKHKNNHLQQNYNPHHNQNSNANHIPYHQTQRNHGRSRSRSQSVRPWQTPRTSKHTSPKHTPRPTRPFSSKPQTPTSPANSLASKATHTLRTSIFTTASGICKRRLSLGLSLTLPTTAAGERLKALLLKAVDDARACIVNLTLPASTANITSEAPVSVNVSNEDDEEGGTDTPGEAAAEDGWRDSGVAMNTDAPTAQADDWGDVNAEEEAVVGRNEDHGCVDLVREHGQFVQRMRWESTEHPGVSGVGIIGATTLAMSQGTYLSTPTASTAPKKMSKGKKGSKNRNDDCNGGGWGDD